MTTPRLQHPIKAVIRPGEDSGYVAECLEIPVVTQGETLDEVAANLEEAGEFHLPYSGAGILPASRARAWPSSASRRIPPSQ